MPARALARVDLAAVERNCARLRRELTGRTRLCAVVKADAYGHGMAPVARAALAGGASVLAVAAAQEAAQLRAEGIEGPVLVMGALSPEELAVALEARAEVVAWREGFVERVAAAGGDAVRVHVKHDTGMGRLGTRDPDELRAVIAAVHRAPGLELAGLMTHFATADERGDAFFGEQLERFGAVAGDFAAAHPQAAIHAANSAATLREPAAHFDMVRCGIAVYGMDPFGEDAAARELTPALSLSSWVADVKALAVGDSAGYGRRFVAREPTRLAVLPIGYGDGVRRALTNNADVLIGGERHPLVGTVSMDNLTVDVGQASTIRPGDDAVLIGAQGAERISAEEVARRMDTINYEVTCAISARVPREHVRDTAA